MSGDARRLVLHAAGAAARVDRYVAEHTQLSRSAMPRRAREGHVSIGGRVVEAGHRVRQGDEIVVEIPAEAPRPSLEAEDIPIDVLYEDRDVIVVDKPADLVVHPAHGHSSGTLVNALVARIAASAGRAAGRPGIVHRLDKDTSGLLVVAKTVAAQASLVRQLAERSMRRVYLAVVQGDPPASGVIDAPVGRDVRARVRMAVTHRGKPARTAYRVLERYGRAALVECRLETGRTHQIRVHFQHIRYPLVGDVVYRRGTRHGLAFPRQALHATELSLIHPGTHQRVTWNSPLPRDMKKLVEQLRND